MKIGIIGAGNIAGKIAESMAHLPEAERYAVASRSLEKAESFSKEYGFARAYGSYEALVEDPAVELVYVATPHSHHYAHMELCVRHKKPFLCEKAFTLNGEQARRIQAMAHKAGVFGAEAIWTRYMPSRRIIQDLLDSGVIGKVTTLTANLAYAVQTKERICRPELGGGALLDLGVYGLNFAFMHLGTKIERIESSVQMMPSGVDGMESITIFFQGGAMAVITNSVYARSDRSGVFYGDQGYMVVENINNPKAVSIYDTHDNLLRRVEMPPQFTGYEYEIRACIEAVKEGKLESEYMPLSETVFVMEVMDDIRRQWKMAFPQEQQ